MGEDRGMICGIKGGGQGDLSAATEMGHRRQHQEYDASSLVTP
jgi:hypothetical protein